MPTGTEGGRTGRGANGSLTSEGGRPVRIATACSKVARWRSTAISEAYVVWSCVCAVMTSERAATPALYWFSAMLRLRLKPSTFSSSTRFSES